MNSLRTLAAVLIALAPLAFGQGTYMQFDYPGSVGTSLLGINAAGDIVGEHLDDPLSFVSHGFLWSAGTFTTIDYPNQLSGYAGGVNNVGQVVGAYEDASGTAGFLYNIPKKTFRRIYIAGSTQTFLCALNDAGTLVGLIYKQGPHGVPNFGFEFSAGNFRTLLPPGSRQSSANGINNLGEVVGCGYPEGKNLCQTYVLSEGKFKKIDIPVPFVDPLGINDLGTIVGGYGEQGNVTTGFIFENGVATPLMFPGASNTIATGINNAGTVVGYFRGSDGFFHGFIWHP